MKNTNRCRVTGFSRALWVFAIYLAATPVGGLSAQTVGREAFPAGGSSGTQALGQGGAPCRMTWTIGEPLNETYVGSKKILSQGFLQGEGYIRDTIGMDTAWNVLGTDVVRMVEFLCYPNPTRGPFQVSLNPLGTCGLAVEAVLTDMRGRRLYVRSAARLPWRETLDLSAYPAGTYLLRLRLLSADDAAARRTEAVRVYKIIKN